VSAREWKPDENGTLHACTFNARGPNWMVAAWIDVRGEWTANGQEAPARSGGRTWRETGIPDEAEAKTLAERWLDEREAETKTTTDGGAA